MIESKSPPASSGGAAARRGLCGMLLSATTFACVTPPNTEETPSPPQPKATLVLHGGTVVTVDEAKPRAEAIAVAGDRILAVGTSEEILRLVGPATKIIELEGQMAMPGFIEGHGHFLSVGFSRIQLDLNQAKNWEEIVAMTADAVRKAEPGSWIFGRGWHQAKWDPVPEPSVDGGPVHDSLSAVSPNNPVFFGHASGHAAFANAKAMALAGIDNKTPDPSGGTIVRDAKGRATGMLRETAQSLVAAVMGTRDESLQRRKAQLAAEECLAKGITSFQDAGTEVEDITMLRAMAKEDALGVRLWIMLSRDISNDRLAEVLPKVKFTDPDHRITVNAIKRMIDGALGSHGALLLKPYTDMPSTSGLPIDSMESLTRTAQLAKQYGFQLCTHAIGDRGNRDMLDIYEKTLGAGAASSDHRWRIEHAQHLDPSDVPRFAKLGIIASMQGVHCTSDGPWVPERLGKARAERTSYLWRSLLDSGAVVSNGTDAPVEDVDPLPSYYASVTRMMNTGEAFYPKQVMTRDEALRTYTLNAAYAAFEEDIKGSLTPGKLADITVLSQDITKVPAEDILKTKVVSTIVGGEVRYRAP
ncbi:MAG: amidohydrolase [Myxococcota bacterium]